MEERIIKDINNLLTQLFQKMKEAGYTFDFEKKELKKIRQKPAWSEEDKKIKDRIMHSLIYNIQLKVEDMLDINDWFDSLKDRVQPQPKQEWSEDYISKSLEKCPG